jgi:hypothetical protein
MFIYIYAHIYLHIGIYVYIYICSDGDRRTDGRTDGQTDRQTDRTTRTCCCTCLGLSQIHTVAEGVSLKVFFRQMKSRSKISNLGREPASIGIPTKVAGRRAARALCGMRPKAASFMEAGSRLEFAVSLPIIDR